MRKKMLDFFFCFFMVIGLFQAYNENRLQRTREDWDLLKVREEEMGER